MVDGVGLSRSSASGGVGDETVRGCASGFLLK